MIPTESLEREETNKEEEKGDFQQSVDAVIRARSCYLMGCNVSEAVNFRKVVVLWVVGLESPFWLWSAEPS